MIVDSSALVAIVFEEPAHERLLRAITDPGANPAVGSPTVAELGIVLSARLRLDARPLVGGLLDQLGMATIPFSEAHWRAAIEGYWRYGRGRHRAHLNFGDCLTYAVASLAAEPLLFVGDDFAHTDLTPALG